MSVRTAVDAKMTKDTIDQNIPDTDVDAADPGIVRLPRRLCWLPDLDSLRCDSNPNCSSRVAATVGSSTTLIVRGWRASMMVVMASHSSQGSQAFPLTPLPRIISLKISATRALRQPFSKSSVGRRTARTPWTSSCLHDSSLRACSRVVEGSDSRGTGDRAGWGTKV